MPRRAPLTYRDATGEAGPGPAYPEVVAGFERLGYRRLGLLGATPDCGVEAVVADYAPKHRATLAVDFSRPAVALVSPDGWTLVEVAWFWGWPSVTASTQMTDGSLVQTLRRWDEVPPWPRRISRGHHHATVEGEMLRAASRGRSVELVAGDDWAALVVAHRVHVTTYAAGHGTAPRSAPEVMTEVAWLNEVSYAHTFSVLRRYNLLGRLLVDGSGIAAALVLAALLLTGRSVGAGIWVLASVPALSLMLRPALRRMQYAVWWRPRFALSHRVGGARIPRPTARLDGAH